MLEHLFDCKQVKYCNQTPLLECV